MVCALLGEAKRLNKTVNIRKLALVGLMVGKSVFLKMLVPVDDSVACLAAQEMAASIAKSFKSSVTVFHAVSHQLLVPVFQNMVSEVGVQEFAPSQIARGEYSMPRLLAPPGGTSGMSEKMAGELNDWYHQKGEEIVEEALRLFKEQGVVSERKIVSHADVADSILREARSGEYSLVVMGRSGEKSEGMRLGGTAEKVVRHSKVPVLVTSESRKISRVLVPVDGSKDSDRALKQAVLLAGKVGAKITLLHVQESGLFRVKPELAMQVGKHVLAEAMKKAKGVEADQKLESGDVGKKIGEVAEKEGYDMIVMGGKGHGGIRRFLLGSASNHVLHYTDHAVLIVK